MKKNDLKILIKEHPYHFSRILKTNDIGLYKKIDDMFDYPTFSQKLYDFIFTQSKSCIICGSKAKYIGINKGYSNSCSYKCSGIHRHNKSTESRNCIICNSEFEIYKKRKKTTCSDICLKKLNASDLVNNKRIESLKRTINEKYGVPHYSKTEKFKETMVSHHQNGIFKYVDIDKKIKKTKLEKYGDVNYNNQTQSKKTMLKNYGVDNYSKTKKFKQSHYKKVIDRLPKNIEFIGNFDNYDGVTQYKYEFICLECNNKFMSSLDNGIIPVCKKCNPPTWNSSKFEVDILEFLNSFYVGIIITSDRTTIRPKELDIYIPEKNLAIECNGNYWHSEVTGNKDKKYHLDKTNQCNDKGIRLIHIFEDEWKYKRDIVKSRLHHILGNSNKSIYARKTEIREISPKEKRDFLEKTHIQGNDKSKIKLGMYYENELISVMTFSKRKIFNNPDWELSRFSTKYNVTGGATKLFKYFIRNYNPQKIITYSDIRWNTGNVYDKLGFTKLSQTSPGYFYLKSNQRINRINFQKHKLKDKLEIFDEALTEWENMQLNEYDRIWDCGNYKYSWESS